MLDLKALIVIIGLSLSVFWLARKPVCEVACDSADFDRRRNLWIAITILAFASRSFWVYIIGTFLLLTFASLREPNRLAMFFALMMAVPAFSETIPGFAGIKQILSLSHIRLLSIVLLLPAYFAIRRQPGVLPFGRTMADKCLLAYLALQLFLQMSVLSATATARIAIYSFTDVFLPYYVASRGLRDVRAFRDALMALYLALVLMAPIAVFEYLRHWLLYSELAGSMSVSSKMGSYMSRVSSVRAVVTSEHSIVLGYLATTALALVVYVRRFIASQAILLLAMSLLVAMLIASGARGPWVGAVAVLFVVLLTGPDKLRGVLRAALIALPVVAALSFTEFGQRLFEVLPFVGTADSDSVGYRERLFEVSILVIGQNPWFGVFDYLSNPGMQELIQGEGIIDVVNSFLGVALTFGIVGLSLFCGVFVFAAWDAWSVFRHSEPRSEFSSLGRALLAALAGILVTIFTVSSIGVIPWVYWMVAGLCVGYAQLVPLPTTVPTKVLRSRLGARA